MSSSNKSAFLPVGEPFFKGSQTNAHFVDFLKCNTKIKFSLGLTVVSIKYLYLSALIIPSLICTARIVDQFISEFVVRKSRNILWHYGIDCVISYINLRNKGRNYLHISLINLR